MTDYHKTVDGIDVRGGIAPNDIPIEVRDKHYKHEQFNTSDIWIIPHNLNKLCSIQTYNSDGDRIFGRITTNELNNIIINFSQPVSGMAICN